MIWRTKPSPSLRKPMSLISMPAVHDIEQHEKLARFRVLFYGALGIASFVVLVLFFFLE